MLLNDSDNVIGFINEVLCAVGLEKSSIGFITSYSITGRISKQAHAYVEKLQSLNEKFAFIREWKEKLFKSKYQITVALLSVFVLFMLISLISKFL